MSVPVLRQGPESSPWVEAVPDDEPARSAQNAQSLPCPVCGGPARRFRSESMVARDLAATETSWDIWRETRGVPPLQLRHDEPSAVDGCDECGTLWRCAPLARLALDPTARSPLPEQYRHEHADTATFEELHRRELLDARADRTWLSRHGVGAGARLLEVSSHVGAFLQFAGEQGARGCGIEAGERNVAYARSLGLDVRLGTLDTVSVEGPFDSVWIRNGFEQMHEPRHVLRQIHSLLRTGGRVVLRTPNADFARVAYEPTASSQISIAARLHQIWGLPFLQCYTPDALRLLLTTSGFDDVRFRARPPVGSSHTSRAIIEDAAVAPLSPWIDATAVAR